MKMTTQEQRSKQLGRGASSTNYHNLPENSSSDAVDYSKIPRYILLKELGVEGFCKRFHVETSVANLMLSQMEGRKIDRLPYPKDIACYDIGLTPGFKRKRPSGAEQRKIAKEKSF
jgi:hypothetical protein